MADTASSKDKSAPPKALVVSLGPFGGFGWKNGRLCLGWIVFSTVPSDVADQLKRAAEEMKSLQAEIARVSEEGLQQLASALAENQALKAQIASVSTDVDQKLGLAQIETEALQAEMNRLSLENQRLQALMERVSSGLR